MTNNDIIRKIRYIFDYNDNQMIELFALCNYQVTRAQICDWLRKEEHPEYVALDDMQLATFLNGLIIEKRGAKDGEIPVPENRLNNNIILRKLKIALAYKDDDMLGTLALVNMRLSKHELSAFFRNYNQSQYRECGDQVIRNFLHGLEMKLRPKSKPKFYRKEP